MGRWNALPQQLNWAAAENGRSHRLAQEMLVSRLCRDSRSLQLRIDALSNETAGQNRCQPRHKNSEFGWNDWMRWCLICEHGAPRVAIAGRFCDRTETFRPPISILNSNVGTRLPGTPCGFPIAFGIGWGHDLLGMSDSSKRAMMRPPEVAFANAIRLQRFHRPKCSIADALGNVERRA